MKDSKKRGKAKKALVPKKPEATCKVIVSQKEAGFKAEAIVKAGTQNHVIGTFGILLARLVLQSKETGTVIFDRTKPLKLAIEIAGKSFEINAELQIKVRSISQIRRFLIGANHAIANAYLQATLAKSEQTDVYILTEDLKDEQFTKGLMRPRYEITKVVKELAPAQAN
jgi:hypothetical protein